MAGTGMLMPRRSMPNEASKKPGLVVPARGATKKIPMPKTMPNRTKSFPVLDRAQEQLCLECHEVFCSCYHRLCVSEQLFDYGCCTCRRYPSHAASWSHCKTSPAQWC